MLCSAWNTNIKLNVPEIPKGIPSENERLFNKLQAKIKMNIDQTDPKNFKGHKDAPKFTNDSSKINEQRKEIIKKHFKKSVKIKKPFKY